MSKGDEINGEVVCLKCDEDREPPPDTGFYTCSKCGREFSYIRRSLFAKVDGNPRWDDVVAERLHQMHEQLQLRESYLLTSSEEDEDDVQD